MWYLAVLLLQLQAQVWQWCHGSAALGSWSLRLSVVIYAKVLSSFCRYCSRRSECSGSNLDQQHKDACSCAYQCDGPCKGFCG